MGAYEYNTYEGRAKSEDTLYFIILKTASILEFSPMSKNFSNRIRLLGKCSESLVNEPNSRVTVGKML